MARQYTPRRSVKKSRKARASSRYFTPPRTRTLTGRTPAGRITGLSRSDFGFPDRLRTKLHYCDVVQLSASAGSPGLWQFRMNSMFDPDYTGTGHQPQWFDQLSAVYTYATINSSIIKVTFIPANVSDTEANDKGPYICGITTVAGTTTFGAATYAALLEDGNSVSGVIVDKQGGNNALTLTQTYNPKRDLGLSPDEGDLRIAVAGNPTSTSQVLANLWCLDMQELAAQDVVCKVEIIYDATFSVRRENVNS